jgi:hypothetical protein
MDQNGTMRPNFMIPGNTAITINIASGCESSTCNGTISTKGSDMIKAVIRVGNSLIVGDILPGPNIKEGSREALRKNGTTLNLTVSNGTIIGTFIGAHMPQNTISVIGDEIIEIENVSAASNASATSSTGNNATSKNASGTSGSTISTSESSSSSSTVSSIAAVNSSSPGPGEGNGNKASNESQNSSASSTGTGIKLNVTQNATVSVYRYGTSISKIDALGVPDAQAFANASDYACTASSDCALVPVSYCNNNMPSQFACIGSAYSGSYLTSYNSGKSGQMAICPMFFMSGHSSCECLQGYCVLVYSSGPSLT